MIGKTKLDENYMVNSIAENGLNGIISEFGIQSNLSEITKEINKKTIEEVSENIIPAVLSETQIGINKGFSLDSRKIICVDLEQVENCKLIPCYKYFLDKKIGRAHV